MAIDSHLTSKTAHRPLPVQNGGWAGRSGSGIIPYGCFDQKTLKEAVAILQGTSKHYRFSDTGLLEKVGTPAPVPAKPAASRPTVSKEESEAAWTAYIACSEALDDEEELHGKATKRYQELKAEADRHFAVWEAHHEASVQSHMAEAIAFLGTSEDFSTQTRQSLYAALCILANTALKQKPALNLENHIKLTVHSHQHTHSAEMQEALDYFREGISEPKPIRGEREIMRQYNPLDETLEDMEKTIAAFYAGETREGSWPYYDTYKGEGLLKLAIGNARWSRDTYNRDEIWRLHNQFPEAVNFIIAAPQAEFLLERNGTRQAITQDLQHFLNSPWMEMAGNLDLTVDPNLLSITRRMLDTQPLRAPAKPGAVATL